MYVNNTITWKSKRERESVKNDFLFVYPIISSEFLSVLVGTIVNLFWSI